MGPPRHFASPLHFPCRPLRNNHQQRRVYRVRTRLRLAGRPYTYTRPRRSTAPSLSGVVFEFAMTRSTLLHAFAILLDTFSTHIPRHFVETYNFHNFNYDYSVLLTSSPPTYLTHVLYTVHSKRWDDFNDTCHSRRSIYHTSAARDILTY